MSLSKLAMPLIMFAVFSSSTTAMTVGEFISYKAMLMSANDPKSPLTQGERDNIHAIEKSANLSLGGIIDGAISLNDVATLKGNSKVICYTTGKRVDIAKFSDDLDAYYDSLDLKKRISLDSKRLGYFVAAFLIKTFPCH